MSSLSRRRHHHPPDIKYPAFGPGSLLNVAARRNGGARSAQFLPGPGPLLGHMCPPWELDLLSVCVQCLSHHHGAIIICRRWCDLSDSSWTPTANNSPCLPTRNDVMLQHPASRGAAQIHSGIGRQRLSWRFPHVVRSSRSRAIAYRQRRGCRVKDGKNGLIN